MCKTTRQAKKGNEISGKIVLNFLSMMVSKKMHIMLCPEIKFTAVHYLELHDVIWEVIDNVIKWNFDAICVLSTEEWSIWLIKV